MVLDTYEWGDIIDFVPECLKRCTNSEEDWYEFKITIDDLTPEQRFWLSIERQANIYAQSAKIYQTSPYRGWNSETATSPYRGWCEEDYVYTPHIAEFWNTISNIALILLSIYGLYWFYKLHRKISIKFTLCLLIGIGSTWYHATLSRFGQLFDEIPMMMLTTLFFMEFVSWDFLPGAMGAAIGSYVILDYYPLFLGYFAVITVATLLFPIFTWKNRLQNRLYKKAIITMFIGYICWLADIHLCGKTKHLHLHAWWHVFSAFALYWYTQYTFARRGFLAKSYPLEVVVTNTSSLD